MSPVSVGESYRPLRELVADQIRQMILSGRLPAGERLKEEWLAEELGVSRNPVREAIRSLEATGMVEVVPRRGAYVCRPDAADARHMLELRAAVEGYAADRAALRRTDVELKQLRKILDSGAAASRRGDQVRAADLHRRFHLAIESIAANPFLEQVTAPLRQRTEVVFSMLADRSPVAWQEHEGILEAIVAGDGAAARQSVERHIAAVLDALERSAIAPAADLSDRSSPRSRAVSR